LKKVAVNWSFIVNLTVHFRTFMAFRCCIFLCCVFFLTSAQAQDVIYLTDQSTVEARGIKITDKHVQYFIYADSSNHREALPKLKVKRIVYEDGSVYTLQKEQGDDLEPQQDEYVQTAGQSYEQEEYNHHFISLTAGLSIPTGVYGSNEIYLVSKYPVGLAKTGYYASLDVGFFFNAKLGISAGYGYFQNDLDDDFLNNEFNSSPADFRLVRAGAWQHHYAVAGPILSIVSGQLISDVRVRAGYLFSSEPDFYVATDRNGRRHETITAIPSKAAGPVVNIGLGIRLKVSAHLAVSFLSELNYGVIEFSPASEVIDDLGRESISKGFDYKQKISTIHLGMGMAYLFGQKAVPLYMY
jgi:hypothetical protein